MSLFAGLIGYAWVPNGFWSTQALIAASHGSFRSILAMPLLCQRQRDKELVVPALVDIAARSSWAAYRMQASKALCRWRAPEAVPLLKASFKKTPSDGAAEALACLEPNP